MGTTWPSECPWLKLSNVQSALLRLLIDASSSKLDHLYHLLLPRRLINEQTTDNSIESPFTTCFYLVVSRPSKNMIQIRSFPQIETKNIWTHQLGFANSISNPNGKWFFWGIPCMWLKVCQGKTYGCFQNWWYPQIIHFNRVFHYKPSILGTPIFGNIQSAIRWRETHLKKKSSAVGGFSPPTI